MTEPRSDLLSAPDETTQGAIHIEGHICEGQSPSQREVRVTVLRGGASINGYFYDTPVLQSIAALLENAQAYVDHARSQADAQVRSVRDMIGFYHNTSYIAPDAVEPYGRIDATLHIMESAEWLWSIINEACVLGRPELIGLSIDIYGLYTLDDGYRNSQVANTSQTPSSRSTPLRHVTKVLSLNSCDVVTRPSAGGAIQHILHADYQGAPPMSDHDSSTSLTSSSDAAANPTASIVGTHPARIEEQQVQTLLADLRLERAQLTLERRLFESALPNAVKTQLHTRYAGQVFESADLERDIAASRQLLADLAADGLVRGHSYEKPSIGTQITEAEKIQAAFDRMFDLEIETSQLGTIRGFSSIREAYARVTHELRNEM